MPSTAILSAALIRDGKLVAAAEEERFRRVKHWAGFPSAGDRLLSCAKPGVALTDVDHVAVNQDSRANLLRKLAYSGRQRPDLGLIARPAQEPARAPEYSRAVGGKPSRRAL